ncbi:tigger transposable element-derived protein 4-like [Ylistrum balloti]|uniref:tigger transposable element-derived protein 4-like n=1 Tax=Ylistrum balloti TaxID=509963 RepID=UPI002905A176|nr:tigger transposable element-derived protein 4-like [Ylistrum balloti]
MLKNAWRQVTPATISNCFRHAGFVLPDSPPCESIATPTDVDDDDDDDIPLAVLRKLSTGVSFTDYARVDDQALTCAEMTDSDILESIVSQRQPKAEDDDDDNDDDSLPTTKQTIHDAMNALDTVRDFLQQTGIGNNTDSAASQIADVSYSIQQYFLLERKQCTLSEFFGTVSKCD